MRKLLAAFLVAAMVLGLPLVQTAFAAEITITTPVDGASYVLNQPVVADYSCTAAAGEDVATCMGPVESGSNIDTSTVGSKTFTVTAKDSAGNTLGEKSVTYNVVYQFSGFLPPLTGSKRVFKAGSTVPVKFQLKDAGGNYISSATAQIWVDSTSNPGKASGRSNTGNYFRYDPTSNQYIFTLQLPKGLAKGKHTIFVTLNDGSTPSVDITVK